MHCVKTSAIIEDTIKKSRFIGIILPCKSEQEVFDQLKQLHAKHPNATHIVYAYRIKTEQGFICRFHDAGEPSGTAGKPVFQYLEGKNMIDLLCVVIRYFGGIKLGAGGLARAYGNTARKALEASIITGYIEYNVIELTLAYKHMQALNYQLSKLDGQIVEQTFSEQVRCRIKIPKKNQIALNHIIQGFSLNAK